MADSVQKRQQRYLKATFIWHRKKNNPEHTHTLKAKLDQIPPRGCVFVCGAKHHSFILFTFADSEQVQGHLK